MKLTLKTGGLLKRYLPEGAEGNTAEIDVPDGLSITGVLEHLGAARGKQSCAGGF